MFVIASARDLDEVRSRLNSAALTKDDIALLDMMLARAKRVAEINVEAGRLSVDRLPIGMDIVK